MEAVRSILVCGVVRFVLRVNSADDLHSWHIIVEVSACRGFVLFMWIVYMGCTMHCVVRQSVAFGHIAVCVRAWCFGLC